MPLPTAPIKRGSELNMQDENAMPLAKPAKSSVKRSSILKAVTAVPAALEVDARKSVIRAAKTKKALPVDKEDPKLEFIPRGRQIGEKRTGPNKTIESIGSIGSIGSIAIAPAKYKKLASKKLFVLDTNVLLHDPMSLFRFQEHDVFIPMMVLEELDNHKKGVTDLARHARMVSRSFDQLIMQSSQGSVKDGLPLNATGHKEAGGKLFFQTEATSNALPPGLPQGKADNQILSVFDALRRKYPEREVLLVSKDINMRIKAGAMGLQAEDYTNDQSLEDSELLYAGIMELPTDFLEKKGSRLESYEKGGRHYYRFETRLVEQMHINQFLHFKGPDQAPWFAQVVSIMGQVVNARIIKDYSAARQAVMGVTARNREQNFALNLLMDPDIDFVTLAGTAGTGKTLMVLAAALHQIVNDKRYNEIVFTRATVPVGDEIGFLPGTEEEKMAPWMGAVDDNLEFLSSNINSAGNWGRAHSMELIRSKIKIKSMSFMRGRTFQGKFLVIDEAQNLTPKQMKTLITRAGQGTKIVCMGNLAQIDTPYLTEGSSGLTFAVERFKGWPHGGHITLAKGERSRLADFASEVL